MNTLIIHHLQTMWEHGYKQMGTCFEDLQEKILDHVQRVEYDRIVMTMFDEYELSLEHFAFQWIQPFPEVFEYGYGWDLGDGFNETDPEWTEGGSHSMHVWVPEWLRQIKGKVDLCGAFDGECIEDMEIALNAAKVPFFRLNHLIV